MSTLCWFSLHSTGTMAPREDFPEIVSRKHFATVDPDDMVEPHAITLECFGECLILLVEPQSRRRGFQFFVMSRGAQGLYEFRDGHPSFFFLSPRHGPAW